MAVRVQDLAGGGSRSIAADQEASCVGGAVCEMRGDGVGGGLDVLESFVPLQVWSEDPKVKDDFIPSHLTRHSKRVLPEHQAPWPPAASVERD